MSAELAEAQWERILPLLPSDQRQPGRAGRPRADNRTVLGGILWVLRTGAPWKDMPEKYGSHQSAHRRYQRWGEDGTLEAILTSRCPERLIGDEAYDGDEHDERIEKKYTTELIAPHRKGRKRKRTQDGRKLRRYTRRWKVERLFAWLQNFRRIVTRRERKRENYAGFVQLGMAKIPLRQFSGSFQRDAIVSGRGIRWTSSGKSGCF